MKIHRGNFESNLLFLKKTGILKKNHKILEIGSGNGAMVAHLKKQGYNVTGTEINPEYMEFAKKHFRIRLKKISGTRLPFESNTFDIVLSFDVFEHIPDSHKHLGEVARILKKDGCYLFTTPNKITNVPFSILKDKNFTLWKKYHCSVKNFWQLHTVLDVYFSSVRFYNVQTVTPFFRNKMKMILGKPGELLLRWFNPDRLPIPFKTNFFVVVHNKIKR